MIDWEATDGIEYRLTVDTDTALAKVLGVTRPAVADMERTKRIARRSDGRWDVLSVVDNWRGTANPYMQQRAHNRPWLDARHPLDADDILTLVRRTRKLGGVVQSRWGEHKWLDAPDPIEHLENDIPLEAHDVFELDFLYPSWETWRALCHRLTDRLVERFKLDERAVRNVVWRQAHEHLVCVLRTELGDTRAEPVTAAVD